MAARSGRRSWREVEKHGGCAYGTEAMHVMRAEKGYVIVGQETDGTVTLADLGLDWAIGKTKKDFVGKRSLTRPDMLAENRKQLVGLLTEDPNVVLEEGAQVTESATPAVGSPALGHVTSSYRSETLGRSIALALVAAGRSRMGKTLHVPDAERRNRRHGRGADLLRQAGSAPPCLTPASSPRSPLDRSRPPCRRAVCPGRSADRGAFHLSRRRGGPRRMLGGLRRRAAGEARAAGEGARRARSGSGPTNGS